MIAIHEVHAHASAVAYLQARLADETEVLENILGMVERMVERGEHDAARDLIAEAAPHRAVVAGILAITPGSGE